MSTPVFGGTFYGYYPDKAALFRALVSPAAEELRTMYVNSLKAFDKLPEAEKISGMHLNAEEYLNTLFNYVYDHFDAFKLIVCCADGTEYQGYIDSLVELEVEYTERFIGLLRKNGYPAKNVTPGLCHMLESAYFNGVFETVAHGMSRKDALRYITDMSEFFSASWDSILGLPRSPKKIING